jgi:hypothetical protein
VFGAEFLNGINARQLPQSHEGRTLEGRVIAIVQNRVDIF